MLALRSIHKRRPHHSGKGLASADPTVNFACKKPCFKDASGSGGSKIGQILRTSCTGDLLFVSVVENTTLVMKLVEEFTIYRIFLPE